MVRSRTSTQTSHQSPSTQPSVSKKNTSRETSKTTSDHTTRTNTPEEKSPEEIMEEEARKLQEIEDERRKQELIEFLEDLGNSIEFQEMLQRKQRERWEREREKEKEVVIEVEEEENKFPLTQKSVEKRDMKRFHENFMLNYINRRKRRFQEEGIKKIRQLIFGDKSGFYCHAFERKLEHEQKLDETLKELEGNLGINLNLIKDKVSANFLCSNKIKKFQRKQQNERRIAIIRKLLEEYERQKQIEAVQNKRYDYKVKTREKVIKDMEIVGVAIPFAKEPEEEIVEQEEENIEVEIIPEPPPPPAPKKVKAEKKPKKDKAKKEKKVKAKKEKKTKQKKEKKPKTQEPQKFTLPQIPIVNERNKIIPLDEQKMVDLIKELPELDRVENEKRLYEMELMKQDRPDAPEDTLTVIRPKELIFKGFKPGMIYKKRLTILNSSNYPKKYRLYKIDLKNQIDPHLLQIEHIGIQHVAPGINFSATVTFSPLKLEEYFTATIIFLSYYAETGEKFQFTISVLCIPLYGEIVISPKEVFFETTRIWVARKRHKHDKCKSFTIKNLGTRTSFVTIKKIRDPLQIEENWDENAIECVENVFNYFEFDNYVLELKPESERSLKVYFKNVDHVGYYFEQYSVDIYEKFDEKNEKFLGCQEITVTAVTTGNYISATPETLDFGLCVLNSVYQLPFALKNNDKLPHCLSLKFPKRLAANLRASATNVIVQPKDKVLIYLKLIPRYDTTQQDNPYYDADTNLLQFPVYICVSEKNATDVPPIKIVLFAALFQPLPFNLLPVRRSRASFTESITFLLTMGECTTRETVHGKIAITNESEVIQHFAFLNLPECIMIHPNYGFGIVKPLQTVILSIMFSPKFEDILETDLAANKICYNVSFQVAVNTIKNLGGIKELKNNKSIVQALRRMEREVEDTFEPPIIREIYTLHYLLIKNQYELLKVLQQPSLELQEPIEERIDTTPVDDQTPHTKTDTPSGPSTARSSTKKSEKSDQQSIQFDLSDEIAEERDYYHYFGLPSPRQQEENVNIEESCRNIDEEIIPSARSFPMKTSDTHKNKLKIETTIVNPLCELSHQFLIFPTTPCGSHSIMTLELRALNNPFNLHCDCGYLKKKRPELFGPIDYVADFEIVGTGSQFVIEPTCGSIRSGGRVKITVIARPETPADIVEDQAKAMKIEEVRRQLIEEKMREKEAAAMRKKSGGGKKKGKGKEKKEKVKKGGKQGGKKEVVVEEQDFTEMEVPENLIHLNYLDYYPAEMCVWRSLGPYSIESDFICTVRYRNCDVDRKQEKLFLKATCKVIRPDFITDLKTQHLDFGAVTIGTTATELIAIQNIKYEPIAPTISLCSPLGPFSSLSLKNVTLPPEATLNLPIFFAPSNEAELLEYIEIRAGKTICPLKISGRGVPLQLAINPEFLVFRLEAERESRTTLTLELVNGGEGKAPIKFVKTHELEGQIVKVEKPKQAKVQSPPQKGGKKKNAKGSSSKSSKSGKKQKNKGGGGGKKAKHSMELTEDEEFSLNQHFKTRTEQTFFQVDDPVVLEAKSSIAMKLRFGVPMTPEELEEEKKGKKKGKKLPKSPKRDTSTNEPKIYYVAKYNILIGSSFWRDLIIVASFR